MSYSHVWDLLLKCATPLCAVLIPLIVHDHFFGINADVVIPMILVGTVIGIVAYRQLVSILASWLYARVNLRVPISLSDAKELRTLFQLTFGRTQPVGWFPMKEVKQLPIAERRTALMAELKRVEAERRYMII